MTSSNLLVFTPKHELQFDENLDDFIRMVEASPNPNTKMDYDSHYWQEIGNFTKMGVNSKLRDANTWLDNSIIRFAKAYIKYQKIRGSGSMYAHFYALRAIEATFVNRNEKVNIIRLLPRDFDNAADEAKRSMAEGATYQTGMKLNVLRNFLIEHNMVKPFDWKNPFKKPKDKKDLTGDEGQKYREDKMPNEDSVLALAHIFAKKEIDLSKRDIFTTSTFSLLMSAPERGSEPLYLKADCLDIRELGKNTKSHFTKKQDDGSEFHGAIDPVDTEKDDLENVQIGIHWFSGKGYGHEDKWIPSVMNKVVTTAIARLKKQSEQARSFAKMLETSADFPCHFICPDVGEDELLTKEQAVAALGLDTTMLSEKQAATSGTNFLKRKGISTADFQVTLRDLNKVIRDGLPDGWPYIKFRNGNGNVRLKWSEALYAGFSNQFSEQKGTIYTELWIPHITTLNEDLKDTKKINRTTGNIASGNKSVFTRHGLKKLALTSHQVRHLLDTLASVNGMSDTLRSKWAGRADPKHNRYYDHTGEHEYNHDWLESESQGDLVESDELKQIFKVQIAKGDSRSLQEYNTLTSLAVHTTEYGECRHSYIGEPCMKHRDCINCNELVCEKGNEERLRRLEEKLKKEKILLKGDKKAVDEGVNGAEKWYERRLLTVKRCEQLIMWLKSDEVKDGDRIKLSDINDITHLDRALEANGKKRMPKIENYRRKEFLKGGEIPVEVITMGELLDFADTQDDDDDESFNSFTLDDF